jgi:hypothetical protein
MINQGDLVVVKDVSDPWFDNEELAYFKASYVGKIFEVKDIRVYETDSESGEDWKYWIVTGDDAGMVLKPSEVEVMFTQ